MSGNQFGMSNMSSTLAREIDSVLPGAVRGLPSSRDGGCTFSVVGNAHSGLSAAAAGARAKTEARATAATHDSV